MSRPAPVHGSLCLVLHAHLPYLRHPEYDSFFEEDWLFEAVAESYLPLLDMLGRLQREGVPLRLTFSLTPTLLSMFADSLLQQRTRRYLVQRIELAAAEVARRADEPGVRRLARMYVRHYTRCLAQFDACGGNLAVEFDALERAGALELLTSAATHGFLPLLNHPPAAVRAQLAVAAQYHRATFGRPARGIWLPECGYYPGLDQRLAAQGLRYTFTEAHGVLFGDPLPRNGTFAPVRCPASGVVVFGRDLQSGRQVWSATEGYPGHASYREFHRDLGYELPYEEVRPYLNGDGQRKHLGLKYHRISGPGRDLQDKLLYDPAQAARTARTHARHFVAQRLAQVGAARRLLRREPLIVAPYDAELFGHWWWEGPRFLEEVIRLVAAEPQLRLCSPSDYLSTPRRLQQVQPALSSWGYLGYAEHWLNDANDWVWPPLHRAAERMQALVAGHPAPTQAQARALRQCGRELLLAQASDWAFILRTGTLPDYARGRLEDHLRRFDVLASGLEQGRVDEAALADAEWRDNLFPDLDWRAFG